MTALKGKIARLPGKLRERVNQMLYDGHSYPKIIAVLEEEGHPGFNEMNISRWRERGYQAWLSAQERSDHRDFLQELAAQTETNGSNFQDAAIHLAQIQFFEALNTLEGADLAQMVKDNRKEFIQLLKTFTHFNRYCLQRDRFRNELSRQEKAELERNKPPKESISDESLTKICNKYNLK